MTPILLIGAGRMAGAMIQGWRRKGAFQASDLMIRSRSLGEQAQAAVAEGAIAQPADSDLAKASTVVFATKPQTWREVAALYAPLLAPDAVIVSVIAGVKPAQLREAFGRPSAWTVPTTGVATGAGVCSIVADSDEARARAHALFDPIATTADIDDVELMHAVTGVSGSAPAYLYAFTEALEAAGHAAGLPLKTAQRLARATMASAGQLMIESGEDPGELRRNVTSPNGVTLEALKVLMDQQSGLPPLLDRAMQAAIARSREIGG